MLSSLSPQQGQTSAFLVEVTHPRKGRGCRPEPGGRKSWAEVRLWLSVCSSSSSGWPWLSSGEGRQGARLALLAAKACLWFMRLGLCVCYGFSTGDWCINQLCHWDRINLKERGLQSVDPLPSYSGLVSRQHTVVRSTWQGRANLTMARREEGQARSQYRLLRHTSSDLPYPPYTV